MICNSRNIITNQKGMALITVLLVTALVAMLAVSMSFAQHVAVRRTANLLEGDQAMVLALGLEEWARWVLNRDNTGSDNLGENWAMGLPPTAVDNGVVSGSFIDMQGRINLNNLVFAKQGEVEHDQTRLMLEQLYEYCKADNGADLVEATVDWVDGDDQGVAEDNEYLLHEPPYLAANRPMTSSSELLLIEGVAPEIYRCVKDHVAALPGPGPTKININTAGPVVISTLSPGLTVAAAEEIVRERPDDGYAGINDFLADPALAGTGIIPGGLSLTSGYFMARARAVFGEAEVELYTLFYRTTLVEVSARSIGTY